MADVIKVSTLLSNYTLEDLKNTSAFIKLASKDALMPDFENTTYTPGRTVDIRRPNRGLPVGDGLAATSGDITEKNETLTIDHLYNEMFDFDVEQLSLDINSEADGERVYNRYLRPQIRKIANKLDTGIAAQFAQKAYLYSGTAGTPIATYGTFADTAALMGTMAIPDDNMFHAIVSYGDGAAIKKGLSNIFNTQVTTPILTRGYIGELDNYQINQSQNINRFVATVPAGTTAAINADVSSGSTIVLKTVAAGASILKGTKITVAGHYMVNSENGLATANLAQFTVTADATVTAGAATITVYPEIDVSATSEWKNLDSGLEEDDVVTIEGSYTVNVAMHPQALTLVCPQMKKIDVPFCHNVVDKDAQLSLQLLRQGNINSMNNQWRLNLLCGHTVHPDYCAIIMG